MAILINKTYEIVTPESAEDGELADSGFVFEDEPHTFRELVRLMREYSAPSCWRATWDINEWCSWHDGELDYRTGDYRFENIHYSRANPPRNAKYWRKAMLAAGIIRR